MGSQHGQRDVPQRLERTRGKPTPQASNTLRAKIKQTSRSTNGRTPNPTPRISKIAYATPSTISSWHRAPRFIAAPSSSTRSDCAVLPCLPIIFPISSHETLSRSVINPPASSASIVRCSVSSTSDRAIDNKRDRISIAWLLIARSYAPHPNRSLIWNKIARLADPQPRLPPPENKSTPRRKPDRPILSFHFSGTDFAAGLSDDPALPGTTAGVAGKADPPPGLIPGIAVRNAAARARLSGCSTICGST
jgi:hypothetical protein